MKRLFFLILVFFIYNNSYLHAQDAEFIHLTNPSFEGNPTLGKAEIPFNLFGWKDCGDPGESPPDIHPGLNTVGEPFFGVTKASQHGRTYLGLVNRPNDTRERVSQKLERPLEKDQCYTFSIFLVRSDSYVSPMKDSQEKLNFTTPINLKIWGGNSFCDMNEELVLSEIVINNVNWKEYVLKLEPTQDISHIILEASFRTPQLFIPAGNILLDNASPIVPIPCEEEDLLAVVKEARQMDIVADAKPKTPEPETPQIPEEYSIASNPDQNIRIEPDPIVFSPPVKEEPPKPQIIKELDRKKLTKGQIIRIDKLYFQADSSHFTAESLPVLDEIYDFMKFNEDVVVEIGGHTNRIPSTAYCDKLSTERAKNVVDYLLEKGIKADRLKYKGYGKRNPVAFAKNLEARRKNQRVEIKILSLNG